MSQARTMTKESRREMQETFEGLPSTLARQGVEYIEAYAKEKPISLALWALGIGFVLGWKLKPW
jgi:ElaB/YqjD/DUF883 family membrane-anchored ribosome-binding protein